MQGGGGTWDLQGNEPTTGYGAGIHPEHQCENRQLIRDITPDLIDDYITQHMAWFQQPGYYVGVWIPEENPDVAVLDVSSVEPELDRAKELGVANQQEALWDIENNQEIPLPKPDRVPQTKTADAETQKFAASDDELCVMLDVPEDVQFKIYDWVKEQDWPEGTDLSDPTGYHVTMLYSPAGYKEHKDADWIEHIEGVRVKVTGIEHFPKSDDGYPYILRLESKPLKEHVDKMQAKAREHGVEVSHFEGGYKPHLTVGYGESELKGVHFKSDLEFDTEPSRISSPRGEPLKNQAKVGHTPWSVIKAARKSGYDKPKTAGETAAQRLRRAQAQQSQGEWTPDHQGILDENSGQDLHGLPGPTHVPGTGPLHFHSHGDIQRIADEYNQAHGLPPHPKDYVEANPENGARVAQAYEQMQHNPNDPQVRAAYEALKNEVGAQYQHAVNNGYQFEFYPQDRDPYPNSPREALLDLHHNKHMYVYPTAAGYGNDDSAPQDHPLLGDSGERWNGQPVTYNDMFRAIHDFYGHAKEGLGFRANGEENAYRQHAAMFTPPAQQALAAETRGQNSWVNYGPYGAQNQTAGQGDTVYAQQKAGILPSWASDPNLNVNSTVTSSFCKICRGRAYTACPGCIKMAALEWQPGEPGKGLRDSKGNFHTWNVSSKWGTPIHDEYLQSIGDTNSPKGGYTPIIISPNGEYTHADNQNWEDDIPQARQFAGVQPGLRYFDPNRYYQKVYGKIAHWKWVNPERQPNPVERGPSWEGDPNWAWVPEDEWGPAVDNEGNPWNDDPAFEKEADWNEDPDLDSYLQTSEEVYPWTRGEHGKFFITPEGEFVHWATDDMGTPHHDVVADLWDKEQAVKGEIAPSGAWWITDNMTPWYGDGRTVDEYIQSASEQAQQAGLQPYARGYLAKHTETCDKCGQPFNECTCDPDTQWVQDPASDTLRDVKPEFGGTS